MEETKKKSPIFEKALKQYIETFNELPPIDIDVCDAILAPERKLVSLMKKAVKANKKLHWMQTYVGAWHTHEPPIKKAIIKRFKMTFGSFCSSDFTEEYVSYDIDGDGFVKIIHGVRCRGETRLLDSRWANIYNIDCVYECLDKILNIMSNAVGIMDCCTDKGGVIDVISTNQFKLTEVSGDLMTNTCDTILKSMSELRDYIDRGFVNF